MILMLLPSAQRIHVAIILHRCSFQVNSPQAKQLLVISDTVNLQVKSSSCDCLGVIWEPKYHYNL